MEIILVRKELIVKLLGIFPTPKGRQPQQAGIILTQKDIIALQAEDTLTQRGTTLKLPTHTRILAE